MRDWIDARDHLVVRNDDAERHQVRQVEGKELPSPAEVRVLAEGDRMIVLEVVMPAEGASPAHVHDHESVGYVVRGRVRMGLGDDVHDLDPGDGFRHPPGVEHSMAALEGDAVWLEIKSPPARTW